MSGVPTRGWYVEIDHPTTGHTWAPPVLDDAQYLPTINDKPEVRIPVPKADRWVQPDWEGEEPTMRAWKDGKRLPIDELRKVESEPGKVVLVGEGGKELDSPVDHQVNREEAWIAARDLTQNNTGYATNFDDPATSVQEELMQSVPADTSFTDALLTSINSTDPYQVVNGGVETLQTCWTQEGEDFTGDATTDPDSLGSYSGGNAARLDQAGDTAEWTFTPDYDVPSDSVTVQVRDDSHGDSVGIEWYLNGNKIDSLSAGVNLALGWTEVGDGAYSAGSGYTGGTLSAGTTYTLKVECVDASAGTAYVADVVAPLDGRYSYTLDNDNGGSGGYLDGPEYFPSAVDVIFDDVGTAFNVVSGRVSSKFSTTINGQAIAVSNDQGKTYKSASNTETLDKSFAGPGATIRLKATLSREGTRTGATPLTGIDPQRLDSFDLYADLEDSPVLLNQRWDTSIKSILNNIAQYGDFIWELRWDSAKGTMRVEWTSPGQRQASADDALTDYRVTKDLRTYGKATVYSSSRSVPGERFSANHGTAQPLGQDHLQTSDASVYDPANGTQFVEGDDYNINYRDGEITTLSSGSMSDGSTYAIDYRYEPRASYAADGYDPTTDRELPPKKINAVSTDREARQAALTIQQKLDTPLVEAKATLSRSEAGRSLIDDLLLEDLPTDDRLEIQKIDRTPKKVVLQLGSRQKIEQVVQDLERRLSETAQRA